MAEPKKQRDQAKPRWYWLFVLVFLALVTVVFYARPGLLQSLRFLAFDTYQRLAPAQPPQQAPVRVVDIDEASLAHLGQWPWSRATMADLTTRLGEAGAAAIAFDILFSEPDRTSPEQMLGALPPQRQSVLRRVIADWAPHDRVFAEALSHYRTVLAASFQNDRGPEAFPLKAGLVFAGDNPAQLLPSFAGVSTNLPILSDAAQGVGFINWVPDRDQVVRRVPLFARQGETVAPSLALEALRVAVGASTYMIRSSNAHGTTAYGQHTGINAVRIGPAIIPTDAQGEIWLHFRPGNLAEHISAWRVINGEVGAPDLGGRIILIGSSAPGLMDLRATPLDASIPGVDVHQQVLEQIVSGHFLTRPDYAPGAEWLVAVLSILLLAFAATRVPASVGALLGLAVIVAICGGGVLLFNRAGYLFDPVFPSLCAFLFAASSATYLYRQTEHQRAEIRRAFGQYVSPAIVRELAAHPERLKLGGEVRDLTLLMCDIRNFTSISEKLNAEELTAFINSFLSPLTDIIIENGGTIDKYMGDAIMAFWNAPIDDPDHAKRGCMAALQIIERLRSMNDGWRAEAAAAGRPFNDVAIGVGLNSGECCVGNLGSDRRFDYSAIGDTVNISSRLESLTKTLKLTMLVGEETAALAPDLPFYEVDLVRLKGRSTPSHVFTLMPDLAASDAWAPLTERHAAFLAAYRGARWSEAETLLAAIDPPAALKGLYEVYGHRIARLQIAPMEQWDGVYELEEK
ncbi:MAG: adenylate/guanylate cyclase domain-containing protein [Vitreimonas sp.]